MLTKIPSNFSFFPAIQKTQIKRGIKNFPEVDFHPIITQESFEKSYYQKSPVLITHGINWSALNKWSFKYFGELFKDTPANLFRFDTENNYARQKLDGVTVSQAMHLMQTNTSNRFKYYLLRQAIIDYFPQLQSDIEFPAWCKFPSRLDSNVWIGEEGSKTLLHYDATGNFLVQVKGEKEVFLVPLKNNFFEMTSPLTGGRFNFSTIKFLEFANPELLKRDFKKGLRCIIKPGMVLYIPAGWWHQVITLKNSISVNYSWPENRIDNACKHFITDYQITSLHNETYPREASQLLKDCTYDNCLETAKKLNDLNHFHLALIVCGAFLEELLKAFKVQYIKSNEEFLNLSNILEQLIHLDSDRFYVPEAERKLWKYILEEPFKEKDDLDKTKIAYMIQSVENFFQKTTENYSHNMQKKSGYAPSG